MFETRISKPYSKSFGLSLLSIFLMNVLVAHLVIPLFYNGSDFLWFSKWDMFSGDVVSEINDISWDGGKTFLFRDHRKSLVELRVHSVSLFHLLQVDDFSNVIRRFDKEIREICRCQTYERVSVQSGFYEHLKSGWVNE